MTNKEMKEGIRKIWIDQIRTAKRAADKAIIENPEDGGTCNFDSAMIKKEALFTYDETIAIFKECGLSAERGSEYGSWYRGWIVLMNLHGQANKNTRWAEAFEKSLKEQGFETSMYYQCD